ncbi:MAG TPA: SOS response-associated peptidase [Candidatus Binatia bacterium]|nr:SOS response-associated peptidase [Candidatus Binatia bacterium]
MCGRYGRRGDKQKIAEAFHARIDQENEYGVAPSYNIGPQTFQPVIRLNHDQMDRELTMMRWGLLPFWSKDAKVPFNTINAKAESVATSPAYREPFKRRRCLIPAEWFYEWAKVDEKSKQPFAIGLKSGQMFALAGLWDKWTDKANGNSLATFTVVTTDPNELMQKIHTRMPVILKPSDYDRWLEPGDPNRLPVDLLRPYPTEEMIAWRVGKAVGNVRNDDHSLIKPLDASPGTADATLF